MTSAAEPVSPPATPPRQHSKPMLPIRGVCSLVERNEDQVLEMIESGAIAWAFNVAADAKRGKIELRVLPAAVAAWLKGQPCDLKWPDVFSLVLPEAPVILACQISRILNVCGTHVYHLIQQKQIVASSSWRKGPGGSARVPVQGFIQFLQKRRFP